MYKQINVCIKVTVCRDKVKETFTCNCWGYKAFYSKQKQLQIKER